MADLIDSVMSNIDKGDYVKVLIGGLFTLVVYQARQNSWLTKELLKLSTETAKVLEGVLNELRSK